jgi:hypothetical protein
VQQENQFALQLNCIQIRFYIKSTFFTYAKLLQKYKTSTIYCMRIFSNIQSRKQFEFKRSWNLIVVLIAREQKNNYLIILSLTNFFNFIVLLGMAPNAVAYIVL